MKRALLALIGVAALAGCGGAHRSGVAPTPSKATARLFAQAVLRQAREWGDPRPTSVVVIPTTERRALRIQYGLSHTSATPETPAYLVVAHGHFVANDAPRPPGAASPTGTILTLTFDAKTSRSLGVGLLRKAHPLSRAGEPEPLALGEQDARRPAAVAVYTRLSRAQATERLRRSLGAKPQHVRLVWADERLTDVVLEWTAYSPHARIRVVGGPIGVQVRRYFRGPAEAWLGADGGPPAGVGSVRPPRGHHILPLRSYSIPVSLVQELGRSGIRIRLAPLRPRPAISRVRALRTIRPDLSQERARPDRIYLVLVEHNTRTWVAWMAIGHGTGRTRTCPPGSHGCPPVIRGRAVELLNATSGHGMMVTGSGARQPVARTSAVPHSHLLAGEVQVVAYPHGDVRICPNTTVLLDRGPPRVPSCTDGLLATGVDVSALKTREKGKPARWGFLYLVGRYANGRFAVKSQRPFAPPTRGHDPFAKPPCAAPSGGWRLETRTFTQMRALNHYSRLAHHHDLVSVAFFHDATILTIASVDPARTRAVLGPYWPRQLCVVKTRYSRATVRRVRERMVGLLKSPTSSAARALGWPTGGGGSGVSEAGQPTTELDVLIVTPKLRALLRRQPPGLVVVQAALSPLR